MKHFYFLLLSFYFIATTYAQSPQGIPYQAAARNSSGAILASTPISVRFTIRDSIATGTIKYRETHSVTTSTQGMFSANIGQGTVVSGNFAGINWNKNSKFLQVEIDISGGSSYVDMGTEQLMSVPYSLSTGSIKLTVSITGDTLYSGGGNYVIIPNISNANHPPTLGASYGGGIVAYILQPTDPGYVAGETHGLIAAPSDQSTAIPWGCYGTLIGGTSLALGTGAANTEFVSTTCGAGTAAKLCQDLVLGGYSDWYLPSIVELQKLYTNRAIIGGFTTGTYWSSSEGTSTGAWYIFFNDASSNPYNKNYGAYIRAVRSF